MRDDVITEKKHEIARLDRAIETAKSHLPGTKGPGRRQVLDHIDHLKYDRHLAVQAYHKATGSEE